ncbi:hypothetical protein BJX99DRAFT_223420 [Aspergillus californicus]
MSPPPVTIEDLQAFHSKHFQSSAHSQLQPQAQPQPQLQPSQPEDAPYEVDTNDDGLGCYPDGMKRTLTDEQVRIFRHSEIHALLRERQIKAENEEYERKFGKDADQPAPGEQVSTKEETAPPDQTDDSKEKAKMAGIKRAADEAESSKPVAKKQSTAVPDVYLHYEEESAAPQPVRRQAASQFAGRRIISYDD